MDKIGKVTDVLAYGIAMNESRFIGENYPTLNDIGIQKLSRLYLITYPDKGVLKQADDEREVSFGIGKDKKSVIIVYDGDGRAGKRVLSISLEDALNIKVDDGKLLLKSGDVLILDKGIDGDITDLDPKGDECYA